VFIYDPGKTSLNLPEIQEQAVSNSNAAPSRPVRFLELDSLRGLAALSVVLGHLQGLWFGDTRPTSAFYRYFLIHATPLGGEAVMLFFVLSGFVLALPSIDGRPQTYFVFITRRIFRIYVPYIAALAISVAGAYWLHGIVTSSTWFHQFWSEPVDWHLVRKHLRFVGLYNTDQFDPPIWSLVEEMRISLIFPFVCALVLRLRSGWSFAIAAILTGISYGLERFNLIPDQRYLVDVPLYTAFFVLGIFLAREKKSLSEWFQNLKKPLAIAFVVACFGAYAAVDPRFWKHMDDQMSLDIRFISRCSCALGSGGLIIACLSSSFLKRILHWQPIHWLGQMSYSLYLLHFVVLLYCVHLLYGRIPLLWILLLTFVVSIVVSRLSYRLIELPSMRMGRKISNSFGPRPVHVSR
jgi:peptidoglycan/LPS O-acetylase OafA/YrhL